MRQSNAPLAEPVVDESRTHSGSITSSCPGATPDPTGVRERVPLAPRFPVNNVGWNVFKNSAAQVAGRVFMALLRLVIAGIIVRTYDRGMFGEYSLVFGVLSIADWLVDFGTVDVFVREICREPEHAPRLLRLLTAAKIVQVPAAFATLTIILTALRYPTRVVEAGLLGGANLIFFGGVLVYRVIFRATLTIEREVLAELLSVVAIVPLIFLVCKSGGGLIALVSCHVFSRAMFLGICFVFGKKQFKPSIQGVTWQGVAWGMRTSAAIGVIGFLVGGYETLDILLLSKLGGFSQLAYYASAQRLIWPLLMALSAVAAAFYPVIASYWPHSRSQFEGTCQRGLDTVLLLTGFAVCSLIAGANFFMGLLGPDLVSGARVLKVLAVLCFVKAITSTVAPVLYVVKAQKQALQFIAFAVVMKGIVIAALAPRFGYMGVAFGAVAVESLFATVPAVFIFQSRTGYRLRWNVPLKVAGIVVMAVVVPRFFVGSGGLAAACIAPALYVSLAFLFGAIRPSELLSLLKWKTGEAKAGSEAFSRGEAGN